MFFTQLWNSIKHELQSRKFRAFAGVVLTTVAGYLTQAVTGPQALAAILTAVVAYITTVAVEDGLTKRG